jgi:hypothetical protein
MPPRIRTAVNKELYALGIIPSDEQIVQESTIEESLSGAAALTRSLLLDLAAYPWNVEYGAYV